jgi:hypothetical protein
MQQPLPLGAQWLPAGQVPQVTVCPQPSSAMPQSLAPHGSGFGTQQVPPVSQVSPSSHAHGTASPQALVPVVVPPHASSAQSTVFAPQHASEADFIAQCSSVPQVDCAVQAPAPLHTSVLVPAQRS